MSERVNELIGKANALYSEVLATYGDPNVTAEQMAQAEAKQKEADALKARASKLIEIQQAQDTLPQIADDLKNGRSGGAAKPEAKTKFDTFGEFVKAVVDNYRDGISDPRLKKFRDKDEDAAESRERKDMSGATGAGGGVLIPVENYGQLMSVAAPLTSVRRRATIIRMRRRQINIPILEQTGTTAGLPSFFGGIQVFWAEEASQKPVSDPKFRQFTLTAHKLIGYTRTSDELLDDADVSLTDFLAGPLGFPGAIAWAEDWAFLRGSGAGQPLGVVNAPATIATTRTTTGTIKYDDVVKMLAKFMGRNPVWLASQSVLETLLLMNGPSGNPSYLWGNAEKGVPNTLMGHPIEFVDKLPAIGAKGDLLLADFSHYVIGDRQATTFEASNQERFQYDQTSFRAVHRVDGAPWLSAPITFEDGATTVSPFVVIAA